MNTNKTELFADPYGAILIRTEDGVVEPLDAARHQAYINELLCIIKYDYPSNYEVLDALYPNLEVNIPKKRFRMAEQLARCCFGNLDHVFDVGSRGELHPERVPCPLRGTGQCPFSSIKAPDALCNLIYRTELTKADRQIASLMLLGLSLDMIAERLGIKHDAARARRNSLYKRTGCNSQPELMAWIANNNVQL